MGEFFFWNAFLGFFFGSMVEFSRWFLTVMAIYPSIWVAPFDFQQSENSRIIYVHVP
jgi:hypothetical protein